MCRQSRRRCCHRWRRCWHPGRSSSHRRRSSRPSCGRSSTVSPVGSERLQTGRCCCSRGCHSRRWRPRTRHQPCRAAGRARRQRPDFAMLFCSPKQPPWRDTDLFACTSVLCPSWAPAQPNKPTERRTGRAQGSIATLGCHFEISFTTSKHDGSNWGGTPVGAAKRCREAGRNHEKRSPARATRAARRVSTAWTFLKHSVSVWIVRAA